jgi:hypothetical protein
MRRSSGGFSVSAAWLLMVPAFATAHHSTQISYHMDRTIDLEGTVTGVRFRNPHTQLFFDVTDDDGSVVRWIAEMASPTNWRRQGWSEETFAPGTVIRISLHPSRSGEPLGAPESITLPDGTVVNQGGRPIDPSEDP